jgi:DNA-binding transcriptional LysR family regulator
MNSDELEFFARVAGLGSISRAALEAGIDQSTATRQIARLEKKVQARLFHRSGRGMVLTEAGRGLLPHAAQVAGALADARRAVGALAGAGPARLVLAAQPTIAHALFGPLALAMAARFPRTRLRLVEGFVGPVLDALAAGEVDIALVYLPPRSLGLTADVLLHEDVVLVVPAAHPFRGAECPVARLAELPLILPSTAHGLRMLAESLLADAGLPLRLALECDGSTAMIRRLVEDGCGCTLLPRAAVTAELARGSVRVAALVDPPVRRAVGIATSGGTDRLPGLFEILQMVRQQAARAVASGRWPGAKLATEPARPA